jgi:hypothetical protein
MDWSQLLTGLVGAGIGTAAVQGLVTLYRQYRTNRGYAKFLAFRIAVQLEEYGQSCMNRIYEIRTHMSSQGGMGGLYDRLPGFPAYPDDPDGWRNVSPEVMHLAYQVKARHDSAQEGLRFVSTEMGFEDAAIQCADYSAEVGLKATRVARSIRQAYSFPAVAPELEAGLKECVSEE